MLAYRDRLARWGPLVLGAVLLIVAYLYSERASRPGSTPESSWDPKNQPLHPAAVSPDGTQDQQHERTHQAPDAGGEGSDARRLAAIVLRTVQRRDEWWATPYDVEWPGFRTLVPLPRTPGFNRLVEQIRTEFGAQAPAAIVDALKTTEGDRLRHIYVALLAGLQDPRASEMLDSITRDASELYPTRAVALYGMALLKDESGFGRAVDALQEADNSKFKRLVGVAVGQYGAQGVATILVEAEKLVAAGRDSDARYFFTALQHAPTSDELIDELRSVMETHDNESVRQAAWHSLASHPRGDVVELGIRRALSQSDREARLDVMVAFNGPKMAGQMDLDMETQRGLMNALAGAPSDLRVSMIPFLPEMASTMAPELAAMKAPDPDDPLFGPYVRALQAVPDLHGRLAEMLRDRPETATQLFYTVDMSGRPTDHPIESPELREILGNMAVSAESFAERPGLAPAAWRLLGAQAAPGVVESAIRNIPLEFGKLDGELQRLEYVAMLDFGIGYTSAEERRVAQGPLLHLLEREPDPMVRMELAGTLLALPGSMTDDRVLARVRDSMRQEIDQLLKADGSLEPTYVFIHPGGFQDGAGKYIGLVRDLMGAFGTPDDIARIRGFASRITAPEYVKIDETTRTWIRAEIEAQLKESVDMIRARSSDR